MSINKKPKIGVGVYIRKDNKILFMLRKSSHGTGTWHPPGGKLEYKESFEECAIREVLEEVNLKIRNVKLMGVTNDIFEEDEHYITIHMVADYESGLEKIMEPDKCEDLKWFNWDNLPKPLFKSNENFLKLNINPFNF